MSEFLTQAQALKAEAARLRAEPIQDERRRDEAHTRASELERQAYVEEVLHDLARQPAIERTPTMDRRAAQVQAAAREVAQAQGAMDTAQQAIIDLRQDMSATGRRLRATDELETQAREHVIAQQQVVDDLIEKEARFFLGRIFRSAGYQDTVEQREAAQADLLEAEDLVGRLREDLQRDDAHQESLLDRIIQAQALLDEAQRERDRAQERQEHHRSLFEEARREEMERRWNALEPEEQVRRIDERRLHERLINERRDSWANDTAV